MTASTDFDFQPVLVGELLRLRPLTADDFAALYAVARDPLIWEQHPANDRWQPAVFQRFFADALASGGAFAVIDNATQAIIGSSRYLGLDPGASEVEIGFTFLAREYWGGRYNSEMKGLMLRHAFRYVAHVVLLIGLNNLRSQIAARRIGAHRVADRTDRQGALRQCYRIDREL